MFKIVRSFATRVARGQPRAPEATLKILRDALIEGNPVVATKSFMTLDYAARVFFTLTQNQSVADPSDKESQVLPADSPLREMQPKEYIALLGLVSRMNPAEVGQRPVIMNLTSAVTRRFFECGYNPSIQYFIERLKIAKKLGRSDTVHRIFEEMEKNGFTLPHFAKSIEVETLAHARRSREAMELFDQLIKEKQAAGLAGDGIRTFNSILDGLLREGLYEEAEQFWQKAPGYGLVYDSVSYDLRISFFVRQGDMVNAELVVKDKRAAGHPVFTTTYNLLLRGYLAIGNQEKVLEIFKAMSEKSVPANTTTYNYIIEAYAKANDPVSAMRVYFSMRSSLRPNNRTLKEIASVMHREEHRNGSNIKAIIAKANGIFSQNLVRMLLEGYEIATIDHYYGQMRRLVKTKEAAASSEGEGIEVEAVEEQVDESQRTTLESQFPPETRQSLNEYAKAAKALFDMYRIECGLNPRFVHSNVMYESYMRINALTSVDSSEAMKLLNAVEQLQLNVSMRFFVFGLTLARRLGDESLLERIWQVCTALKKTPNVAMHSLRIGVLSFKHTCVPGQPIPEPIFAALKDYAANVSTFGGLQQKDRALVWILLQIYGKRAPLREVHRGAVEILKTATSPPIFHNVVDVPETKDQ